MATYVVLLQYTQQGLANVKQSPARIDAAKKAFRAMGAEIKQIYAVMGQYDLVTIAEAPDDETITKVMLSLGSQGNARTQTLRAFSEDELRKIIAGLP